MGHGLTGSTPQVDIGLALKGLTADPQWFKKYAIAGLFLLVPIVGPIAWLGWLRRVYEAAREGDFEFLPEIEFSEDLSLGIAPLVAMLNLMVPAMVMVFGVWIVAFGVLMVGSGVDQATDGSGVGGMIAGLTMLVLYGLMSVGILAINLLTPEIQRRGFNGEMTPLLSPGTSLRALVRSPGPYLMTLLGIFLANLIASVGVLACYIGMFLTMPMAMVVMARLLAQWDAVVTQAELRAGELS